MNKEYLKKSDEELTEYLQFRRRASRVEAKKGKGYTYKRSKQKEENRKEEDYNED